MSKPETLSALKPRDEVYDNSTLAEYTKTLREKYTLNNKVLLVQTPQFLPDAFNIDIARNRGYYAYPPTGLQCIARALSGRDLEIDILDLNYLLLKRAVDGDSFHYLDWINIFERYLEDKERPSIIGVTCISVYVDVFETPHPLTSFLEYLRKEDRHIIIAGGAIATNEYEGYLDKDLCHFVVEGEGEDRVNFIFDHLFKNKERHTPAAGIYFKPDGHIEEAEGEKKAVALEGNLIDTYKCVSVEDYNNVGSLNPFSRMAGKDRRFACMQLNRGCRADCRFCGVTEFIGKGLRQYPVEDALKEVRYLVKERGIRHFEVLDDDFLTGKAVLGLLEGMVELRGKYGITWAAGNGLIAASLTEEILSLMRDSGCVGFRVGIESGNTEMLKRMRKPLTLSLLRKTGRMLQKFPELFVGGNYIIGIFGEETFGKMLETFNFSCEIDLDWAAFTAFQFTSKATALKENFNIGERRATDFIPAKDTASGEIMDGRGIVSGPEIFSLPRGMVPSREQISQIWFAFNLVANYFRNKNLRPGGRPEKFTSWVEAIQDVYPDNPYMPLFAGLGQVLLGNNRSAERHIKKTKENLGKSVYWSHRFAQFELMPLVAHFPTDARGAREILESLPRWERGSRERWYLHERI